MNFEKFKWWVKYQLLGLPQRQTEVEPVRQSKIGQVCKHNSTIELLGDERYVSSKWAEREVRCGGCDKVITQKVGRPTIREQQKLSPLFNLLKQSDKTGEKHD